MPGLNLNVGGFGYGSAAALPTASNLPEGQTVNQAAFGIGTSQTDGGGARTAGFGTVGLGIAGAVLIAWLWYTLPR